MVNINNQILRNVIGKKAKAEREKKGITQEELAKHMNLGLNAISSFENGKKGLKMEFVYDVASALNISPHLLFPVAEEIMNTKFSPALETYEAPRCNCGNELLHLTEHTKYYYRRINKNGKPYTQYSQLEKNENEKEVLHCLECGSRFSIQYDLTDRMIRGKKLTQNNQ